MSRTRAPISLRTKLASALCIIGGIKHDHASAMTADQVLSLFVWDHAKLHALDPDDHHANLTPRYIAPHREKSRKDTGIVAKVRRLARVTEEASRRLLAKEPGKSARPKSKWGKRKMQSRNSFQRRPSK